jgi:hypothetical protein
MRSRGLPTVAQSTGDEYGGASMTGGHEMTPAIRFQPTPNPNAGKFIVGRPVVPGKASKSFYSAAQAAGDALATALFELDGVSSLFMVDDFVTVTKQADADWAELVPAVIAAIEASGA